MQGEPRRSRVEIVQDWRGRPIAPEEHVRLDLMLDDASLVIDVAAPLHGDPPPAVPAGRCDGLWNHEVVELFLLGRADRYVEIELGPWGHYLVLSLEGERRVVGSDHTIEFDVTRDRRRWTGRAIVPARWIPEPVGLGNAYAIHGEGAARRYLALHAVPGGEPDFHRLERFGPIGL